MNKATTNFEIDEHVDGLEQMFKEADDARQKQADIDRKNQEDNDKAARAAQEQKDRENAERIAKEKRNKRKHTASLILSIACIITCASIFFTIAAVIHALVEMHTIVFALICAVLGVLATILYIHVYGYVRREIYK